MIEPSLEHSFPSLSAHERVQIDAYVPPGEMIL